MNEDLFVVMKEELKLPILTKEQEETCSKKDLVKYNLKLVINIAKKYSGGNETLLLDLVQEGCLGLLTAVEKFNPKMGYKFSTYAVWWIRQAITRKLFNLVNVVPAKSHIPEKLYYFDRAYQDLTKILGREPEKSELAEELNISLEKVNLYSRLQQSQISLDEIAPPGDSSNHHSLLGEYLRITNENSTEEDIDKGKLAKDVQKILGYCTEQEAKVIRDRFGIGSDDIKTLKEIGNSMNLSRERIRQVQQNTIRKIKRDKKLMRILSQYK